MYELFNELRVLVQHSSDVPTPSYQTEQSSGMDLSAHISERVLLRPNHRKLVPTGISIALPEGYEAQIRPRSGLAVKHGVTVLNSPGTIDADYRGEIKVLLVNLSNQLFELKPGDRIAQMVFAPVCRATLEKVSQLPETTRGEGGFGSTGTGSASVDSGSLGE